MYSLFYDITADMIMVKTESESKNPILQDNESQEEPFLLLLQSIFWILDKNLLLICWEL